MLPLLHDVIARVVDSCGNHSKTKRAPSNEVDDIKMTTGLWLKTEKAGRMLRMSIPKG